MKNSSVVSMPNPTALLFLLATIVAWFVLIKEEPDSPVLLSVIVAVCVALAPILFYALSARWAFATIFLVVATAMPRLFVSIGGLKARPEHIASGILLFTLPYWVRRRKNPLIWMAADYLVLAYIAVNFFSSTFMSIAPGQTIKWCVQQAIVIFSYFIVRFLVTDKTSFERTFHILLMVGVAEAVFGIICFYSNLLFGTEVGVEIGQYGTFPGTYGVQFEANLLGAYCGAAMVMCFYMYLWEQRKSYLYGFALTLAALSISLSRGALLATGVAFGAFCLRGWRLHLFRKEVVRKLAFAVLYTGILIVPTMYAFWAERFSSVDISQLSDAATGELPAASSGTTDLTEAPDSDIMFRIVTVGLAADGIMAHPFLGNGTASYQLQFSGEDFGLSDGGAGWIGNTEVRVQYDTGLVGLIIFSAFLLVLARSVKKQIKGKQIPQLESLAITCLLYCVSFQFTEGTLLAFTWLHLGLMAAGVAVFRSIQVKETLMVDGPAPKFS